MASHDLDRDSALSAPGEQQAASGGPAALPRRRWVLCGLLFAVITINYMDRQVIGVLKPFLQRDLGWSERDYGDIVVGFQVAYALGFLFAGRVTDVLGSRLGYAAAATVWSLAEAAHALVRTVAGFLGARFLLGLGEAGAFPAAMRTVADWFPPRERALATGLANAGANVGAVLTPLLVPPILIAFGWRAVFLLSGALGVIWTVAWLIAHRGLPRASRVERLPSPTWRELLRDRRTWAYMAAKFLTDPIWWLYLFWLPDFFVRTYHLNLRTFGLPLVAIYLVSDLGSVGGGSLSSWLLARGWEVGRARRTALLVCALCALPVMSAAHAAGPAAAAAVLALAAAGHQGWSANLLTSVTDMFPPRAVGSVIGLGGAAGALGGVVIAKLAGEVLGRTGGYTPLMIVASLAYVVALLLHKAIAPSFAGTYPRSAELRPDRANTP